MAEDYLAIKIEEAKAADIPSEEGFVGNTRSLGVSNLEVGDVFRVPKKFSVFTDKVLTTRPDSPVQYTLVEIFGADGKVVGAKKLYAGTMQKTLREYHIVDGQRLTTGKVVSASGDAVMDFVGEKTIQDSMKKIAGNKILVKSKVSLTTRVYDESNPLGLTTGAVYEMVYVD